MTGGGQADIIEHFRVGLEVVKRHPVLVVPQLVAQVAVFMLLLVFAGGAITLFALGGVAGGVVGAIGGALLLAVVAGGLSLVAAGVVIVMARDALAGREPQPGDALGVVMNRFVDVLVASLIAMGAVGLGVLLLVVPGIVAGFFLIFTLPAVLIDGDGALDAVRRSCSVVSRNVVPVLGLLGGFVLVTILLVVAAKILGLVPLLGQLVSALLFGVFVAYMTVVVVRVYQALPRG